MCSSLISLLRDSFSWDVHLKLTSGRKKKTSQDDSKNISDLFVSEHDFWSISVSREWHKRQQKTSRTRECIITKHSQFVYSENLNPEVKGYREMFFNVLKAFWNHFWRLLWKFVFFVAMFDLYVKLKGGEGSAICVTKKKITFIQKL